MIDIENATEDQVDAEVLRILSVQSSGYLIWPNAMAFYAEGLTDSQQVEKSLNRLTEKGHAALNEDVGMRYKFDPAFNENNEPIMVQVFDEKGQPALEPALDDDGNEIIIQHGWEITEEGRKELS